MKNKKQSVSLYDTTLRDGNQALGISFSLSDKLRIAEKLDEFGIHYIEGGWPNPTSPIDTEFYREVSRAGFHAKIAAFGSTRRPGCKSEDDPFLRNLVETGVPVATIFGKSWGLHVTHVIGTDKDENLRMITDSVRFLKKNMEEVIYDAEHFFDGYKSDPQYAISTLMAAGEAGADCIVLCDTNGGVLPDELVAIFLDVKSKIPTPLGIHAHNDSGCADANSCVAVINGAVHIQGTINGLGERCGNANLCTIIPNLQLKRGFPLVTPQQLKTLSSLSVFIAEIANVIPDIRAPYVGKAAFSHKAGAHADGVRKVRESFEHVSPDCTGNERQFVVSDQAGSGTMLEKLETIRPGLNKKDPDVKKLLLRIKELESQGYQFEAAEGSFELIAREMLGQFREPFIVMGFRVIEEKKENGKVFSEATIKIKENDVFEHTAAEGDGPVNALDNALRKALIKFYPSLSKVKLEDFKVRVLDGRDGTESKVRVLIESSDGISSWGTVGVSTNIIEASWLALIDSLKYKLMKDKFMINTGKSEITSEICQAAVK
ncbi:MAG: citramalate synthase [Fibrobacter sp.]|jgi:2-isopropylmalate synthase|nr:citramalate synthase [Fibrobacter sp.]